MEKRKERFLIGILSFVFVIILLFSLLFSYYWTAIIETVLSDEALLIGVMAIIVRATILGIMAFFLFRKWFNQEAVFLSDAYFLFGSFFSIFATGKVYDVFYNLAVISGDFSEFFILNLAKIRYLIILITAIPILFLALEAILTFVNMYKNKDMNRKQFNKLRLRILMILMFIIAVITLIAPNLNFLLLTLPYITIGIFLGIAIMFLFMYKNKRLSQVNGLIIGIAFILFIFSNLVRVILTSINLYYSIFAELIDIGVNLIMFFGFITKPKYNR